MSIIYDTLKKTQDSIQQGANADSGGQLNPSKLKLGSNLKVLAVYLLTVCLGIIIAKFLFDYLKGPVNKPKKSTRVVAIKEKQSPKPFPASVSTTRKESKEPLILNGIFFSQEEPYALINNQIVKESETIEGATVKRIKVDEVELERQGSILTLKKSK
jgi:hypothetical protein